MKIIKIGSAVIKINALTLICFLLWALAGELENGLIVTAVVILHELAHAACACLLGMPTESIELFPFGGAAKITGIDRFPAFECIIASAGPIISFLSGYAAYAVIGENCFTSYSYTIALLNFLPVYPLDGGRIFSAAVTAFFGRRIGFITVKVFSLAVSGAFFIYCMYRLVVFGDSAYIVSAVFLIVAAAGKKAVPHLPHLRRDTLKRADTVRIIKAYESTPYLDITKQFNGNYYYIVLIVDNNENPVSVYTETEILGKLNV